jgi:hypothetical protein
LFLSNLPKTFPGFKFKNIQIHIDTPDQAFGEYEATAVIASNGKDYAQHYMGRVVAENGKIKLIREALIWCWLLEILKEFQLTKQSLKPPYIGGDTNLLCGEFFY